MQRIAKKNSLIKVKLICADCKEGRHGCAGLWRGLGLEIHCCCSCIRRLERQGVSRENSEQKDEVPAKEWDL
jgi:hypothetical protein